MPTRILAPFSGVVRSIAFGYLLLMALMPAAAQDLEVAATVAQTEGLTLDREGNVYSAEMMTDHEAK
jgi:hypothetical protein